MNDREDLIKACVDSPEEETLRLILADWYEEHDAPLGAADLRGTGCWTVDDQGSLYWDGEANGVLVGTDWKNIEWGDVPWCADCHTTEKRRQSVPCPFDSEINGDYNHHWLCGDCQHERAQDI